MELNKQSYKKISKPTIIVTSLGRTGTKFFQAFFKSQLPQSCSLHEPDVFNYFQYSKGQERINQVWAQLKESGFTNLFVRKLLGQWSLINISDDRVCGEVDFPSAVKKLYQQRYSFVNDRTGSPYIESNAGYYGLLDTLDHVYEQYRVVYIIRDGRDWIQSKINWGQMYGKSALQKVFAHTWPTAYECGEVSLSQWESMPKFEKLCWAWVRLNEFALNSVGNNPNIRVVKFEDIFISDQRYDNLQELLEFLISIDNPGMLSSIDGWLEKRIHGSWGKFPKWEDWTSGQKAGFIDVCGPLMNRLNYPY